MKRKKSLQILAVLMALLFLMGGILPVSSEEEMLPPVGAEEGSLSLSCRSAVLMEATTGTVLYTQNPEEAMPPASVTKIMTLLLLMEAIDGGSLKLTDTVTVSPYAASMGGSQVFLKEGEQMVLEDLLKSVVIASANDAAVALAEHLHGSVSAFVERMNQRAEQLGMRNTHFENVTGLDDTAENHVTSAHDIALMSRALISHPTILKYSSLWMDTIRDGAFGLTNTNRLVRFYPGCTGLKTGSTAKAGFCVSVTAERDGLSLICVIMGAESRDIRNTEAMRLLDWGFANYGLYTSAPEVPEPIRITGGREASCPLTVSGFSCVLKREDVGRVTVETVLPESLSAPLRRGDKVGELRYLLGDVCIGSVPILAGVEIERIGFFTVLCRMLTGFLLI